MKPQSAEQTLRLLRGISMMKFRPMNSHDYEYFAGAESGAVISDENSEMLAGVIGDIQQTRVDPDATIVVVSRERVELHGTDRNGEPFDYFIVVDEF